MAQTAEINRDPKKRSRPFAPKDFHPMYVPPPLPVATDQQLREMME
jgi:hypothetical protein